MNRLIFHMVFVFFLLISSLSQAQLAPDTYWIQFTDKKETPYRLDTPEDYLSAKSIERRTRYHIAVDSLDIPVNSWYLDSLIKKGAQIVQVSKWLNGAAVYTADNDVLQSIYDLLFVDETASTSPRYSMLFCPNTITPNITQITDDVYDYGGAYNQIALHNGQILHNNGYQGQGMSIAIIDAGFRELDQVPAFDSLFINNQIIGTWDFVDKDTNVYDDHYHGKSVLSTIAGNISGEIIGTAPKANFLLLRSEDVASEYKIEEINWATAAEYADSIGVDIITTSLGYNTYSSPSTSYTWSDLDGKTSAITIATDIAATRGLFMVTSAGNEGSTSWKKITSPADAKNALTVGACKADGEYASFSSRGFTEDHRIKPDVCAQGESVTVITSEDVTTGNGTSFSTPIIAGLVACLWQVDRSKDNFTLMDLIKQHSHQFFSPDSIMGYGIPNFGATYNDLITDNELIQSKKANLIKVFPTLFDQELSLKFFSPISNTVRIEMLSVNGSLVYTQSLAVDSNTINFIHIDKISFLSAGVYFLRLISDDYISVKKVIKE